LTEAKQSSGDDASTEVGTPTGPLTCSSSSSGDHHKSQTVRRLVIIAVLLVIGVVAFEWANGVYPAGPPTTYSAYQVYIHEGGSPGGRPKETFTFERQPDGTIKINWTITSSFTSTGSSQTLQVTNQLDLFGRNITLIQCPEYQGCSVINSQADHETVITFSSSSPSPETETAVVRDPSLGFSYNNETALAEMPYVSVTSLPVGPEPGSTGSGSAPVYANDIPVSVNFGYDIPGASNYDWSLPPRADSSSEVTWGETVNPNIGQSAQQLSGEAQPVELTGTNQVAQATDNKDILLSGVLFGIAGAAALGAVVEFLHLIFKVE
jgi:hypothetical protein